MNQTGQTSFEYILIAGGILLMIVVVLLIVRSNILAPINSNVNSGVNNYTNILNQFNGS